MGRRRASGVSVPGWARVALCALAPLVALNLAVAWFGETWVFPLSFSFLQAKARALGAYARHRPGCLVSGHPPLEPLITAAERRHHLPPGLLHALIQVESETRVHRISPTGAMGPGQLMPGTARMMRVEDPFDPEPAIEGSARYLAEQLRRFDDVKLAVAAYNAGPGNVDGRVPRNGETEFYVARVLDTYARTRPPPRPAPAPLAVPTRAPAARPTGGTVKPTATITKPSATVKRAEAMKPTAHARPEAQARR